MRTTWHHFSGAVLLWALSSTGQAATTTQTFTFGNDLLGQNIFLTTPIAFNKFNPALGTLTGVSWTVSGNINYLARGLGGPQVLDPESGELVDTFGSVLWDIGRVRMQNTAQVDVATLTINPEVRNVFILLSPNATTAGYPGFQQFYQTPFAQTVNFAPGDLNQFSGTGSGNLYLFSQIRGLEQSCFSLSPPANYCLAVFGFNAQRPFTSTLTFTYTPAPPPTPAKVPLPTAAILGLGLALAGIGSAACQRNRR